MASVLGFGTSVTGRSVNSVGVPEPDARLVACEKALYYIMQSVEGRLGGGEGIEGLYGSLKRMSMQTVLDLMVAKCGLSSKSHLVDVGAGLGRPLLHAMLRPGIASSWGVEVDRIKCDKAHAFVKQTLSELQKRDFPGMLDFEWPVVHCNPIEEVETLEPATHAYSFWEGVPLAGKEGFGRLFASSRTLQGVAVVQRAMRADPAAVMAQLGFGSLVLVARTPVSMSGSGRMFTAYVFKRRLNAPPLAPSTPGSDALKPANEAQHPKPGRLAIGLGAIRPSQASSPAAVLAPATPSAEAGNSAGQRAGLREVSNAPAPAQQSAGASMPEGQAVPGDTGASADQSLAHVQGSPAALPIHRTRSSTRAGRSAKQASAATASHRRADVKAQSQPSLEGFVKHVPAELPLASIQASESGTRIGSGPQAAAPAADSSTVPPTPSIAGASAPPVKAAADGAAAVDQPGPHSAGQTVTTTANSLPSAVQQTEAVSGSEGSGKHQAGKRSSPVKAGAKAKSPRKAAPRTARGRRQL